MLLGPGVEVEVIVKGHVIVGVVGIPCGAKEPQVTAGHRVNILGNRCHVAIDLELLLVEIKCHCVFRSCADKLVCATALALGCGPLTDIHGLIAACAGAKAVSAVKDVPIAVEAIGKAEIRCSSDGGHIGIGAIGIIVHLNALAGVPALAERRVAHDIDGRISAHAHHGKHH